MILCWVLPCGRGRKAGQKVSAKAATHTLSLCALGKPCPLIVPQLPCWQILWKMLDSQLGLEPVLAGHRCHEWQESLKPEQRAMYLCAATLWGVLGHRLLTAPASEGLCRDFHALHPRKVWVVLPNLYWTHDCFCGDKGPIFMHNSCLQSCTYTVLKALQPREIFVSLCCSNGQLSCWIKVYEQEILWDSRGSHVTVARDFSCSCVTECRATVVEYLCKLGYQEL